jgi:tetratricopeptide (TPR) repeat protein
MICEEKLQNVDMATMCYQNILSISPTYIPALRSLGQTYATKGNWGGMIAMFHREAQVTNNTEKQFFLMTRIAEIFEEKLQDSSSAEKMLLEILQKEPNYMPAYRLLENIYQEAARHEELAKLYKTVIHHQQTNVDTVGLTSLKLAKLLHLELDQADVSEAYYLKAIDHNFGVNTCIAALDQIYSQASRFRELSTLLMSVLQKIQEPSYLFNILYRLGVIDIEYLDSRPEGMSNLLQAHKINPNDLPLLWDLTRYLEQDAEWPRLASIYADQAAAEPSVLRKTDLLKRAAHYYRNAGNLPQTQQLLEQVLQSSEEDLQAIETLIELHRKNEEFDKLAVVLRKQLALQKEPDKRTTAARELAAVYELRLNQPDKAIAVLEKILEEPGDYHYPILANLEKLLLKKREWSKLVLLYPKLISDIQDNETIVKLELRQGEAFENLKEFPKALETYKRVLALSANHVAVRTRIRTLLRQLQNWVELVQFLEEESKLQKNAADALWEIADIYEKQLNNLKLSLAIHCILNRN